MSDRPAPAERAERVREWLAARHPGVLSEDPDLLPRLVALVEADGDVIEDVFRGKGEGDAFGAEQVCHASSLGGVA